MWDSNDFESFDLKIMKSCFFCFFSVHFFSSRSIVLFTSLLTSHLISSPLLASHLFSHRISSHILSSPFLLIFQFLPARSSFYFSAAVRGASCKSFKNNSCSWRTVRYRWPYLPSFYFFLVYMVWFLFCHSFASLLVFDFWFLFFTIDFLRSDCDLS